MQTVQSRSHYPQSNRSVVGRLQLNYSFEPYPLRQAVIWAKSSVDTVANVKQFSDNRVDTAVEFEYTNAQMHLLMHYGTNDGHLELAWGKQAFIHSFDD